MQHSNAMHLALQYDQLMAERYVSASSQLFDLNGEAKMAKMKKNSANIVQ